MRKVPVVNQSSQQMKNQWYWISLHWNQVELKYSSINIKWLECTLISQWTSSIDKIALRGICCLENIVSSFQRTSRRDEDLSWSILIILIKMDCSWTDWFVFRSIWALFVEGKKMMK